MELITLIANGLILLILSTSALGWIRVVQCWLARRALIDWDDRRPAPWGALQLVGLLLFMLVLQVVAQVLIVGTGSDAVGATTDANSSDVDPVVTARWIQASSVMYGVWLVATWYWLTRSLGASARDLGWNRATLTSDIGLGVMAFAVIAPVVYALQLVLIEWWPSHHPLVEAIKVSQSPEILIGAVFSAVVMAPIFEEFAFRVLVQGWFQNIAAAALGWRHAWWKADHDRAECEPPPDVIKAIPTHIGVTTVEGGIWSALWFGTERVREPGGWRTVGDPRLASFVDEGPHADAMRRFSTAATAWRLAPMVASSLIFSLLHFDHGPDWIPLLVLAMALGYLYQRTHRIVPCIVVHSLLNGVSFVMLLAELSQES